MPKCRFPHPPFKIPEHLPKPADPIANPPAAAAKQKAVAQAHAAALAAERNPLCKEMAIVTWLGHWQCNCGKVHKLWDACKCGQQPPCREWVRGQCDLPKCRFPHPPFAIPSSLPKPDDPIANPTPEQLAIPLQTAEPTISNSSSSGGGGSKAAGVSTKHLAQAVTANGKADSSAGQPGSGGSTPVAHSSSVSSEAAGQLPNPGVYGAVGQPVPANGHAKQEAAIPPPPPPSTTKPGISFRAALLAKSAAAAAGGQQGLAEGGEAGEGEGQPGIHDDEHGEREQQADLEVQEQPEAPSEALEQEQQHLELQQQQFLAAAEAEQAQQAQQQQDGLQNGTLDPVVAAPASARSNQAAAAATAGALGWNPMAKGVFSPLGPSGPAGSAGTGDGLEGQANAPAGGLASHMGSLQLDSATAAAQPQQQQQALQQSASRQGSSAASLQLPPPPAPVATHPPTSSLAAAGTAAGQQSQGLSGPSPRVPHMMPVGSQQPGSAHLPQPVMSPRMSALQQQQQAQGGMGILPTSVAAAMSPRGYMQQQQQQQPGAGGMVGSAAAPGAMSPRYMSSAAAGRPSLSMAGGAAGLKPGHLGGGPYANGMAGQLGSGLPQQQQQQQQQQQYTLQAALQQMALQQQQAAAAQQQQQQQKPVHVVAKTLLEYGLMDPAFYHALRQVDFLPDGYYQQDTLTLEDQQRRMELFNAAVDSYIAAGVDSRSMLEISCQAKIGLTGGPLYYRCATCGQPIPTEMRQRWCPVCKVTPFCSPECHHRLFQQHRGVCNSMLTKPLLPSQIALRIAVEIYNVHGLTGAALHQAILRQTAAVQRSYAAAAAAATVAGVVDE
ncbi:hypothetical protein N2152v2_001478 [Parachlorella kessleri]